MLHITFSKYACIIVHKAYYLFTCTCVSINSFHSHSHSHISTFSKPSDIKAQAWAGWAPPPCSCLTCSMSPHLSEYIVHH